MELRRPSTARSKNLSVALYVTGSYPVAPRPRAVSMMPTAVSAAHSLVVKSISGDRRWAAAEKIRDEMSKLTRIHKKGAGVSDFNLGRHHKPAGRSFSAEALQQA